MSGLDASDVPEQRLHPLSWLFVLLQQLRQFIVPLVALVVFGQSGGDDDDASQHWVTIAVIGVLVATSLLQYLTYRYRIGQDSVNIRSGWIQRRWRDIPFARIHNVGVHQSLLHRLFGVAEVRLESAGGQRPEAEMRVLRLDQALALEQLIRRRGQAPLNTGTEQVTDPTLLGLSLGEIIRLGLISNRGMVVVIAGFGFVYQLFPRRLVSNFIESNGPLAVEYAHHHLPSTSVVWVLGVLLLLVALAATRLMSVVLAMLQYYGFRLSETDRRLTVERGLLARLRTSVARRRIQAWTLQESMLHRMFGRRRLRVDTAVVQARDDQSRGLRELAPVATPQACDALIRHLLPKIEWPPSQWHGVHVGSGWRLSLPSLLLLFPLSVILAIKLGPSGLLILLWLPWSLFKSYRQVLRMGWAQDDHRFVVRGGWWTRWWRFAELDKLQGLQLTRSPIDRWLGTATLMLDTAGAGMSPQSLSIRFMPVAEADALMSRLRVAIAQRQLRW